MFNTVVCLNPIKKNIIKLIVSLCFFLKVLEECAMEDCSVST